MRDLASIAVFAKVVESNSFTAAAQELHLTPSAVSKQVSRLEDHLGAQLLNRTTRRLSLTEVGAHFYQQCSKGLKEIAEAEDLVSEFRAEPRGLLRVSVPQGFGRLHVAPIIPDFLARYPDVQVELTIGQLDANLFEHGFDLMIRSAPLTDANLAMRELAPMRRVVCATPDYFARHGVPATPRDLAKHNCLIFTDPQPQYEWRFTGPKGDVAVRVSGSFQSNQVDALYVALMRGVGIAYMPNYNLAKEIRAGELKTIFEDWVGSESRSTILAMTMKAYYPRAKHPSPKVVAFIDFLVGRIKASPDWD